MTDKEIYTIAVDFDGTLAVEAFPDIRNAKPREDVVYSLKDYTAKLANIGYDVKLILWTCREDLPEGAYLSEAVEYCKTPLGLKIDAVNTNPWSEWETKYPDKVRKIHANEYWDDRSFNFNERKTLWD